MQTDSNEAISRIKNITIASRKHTKSVSKAHEVIRLDKAKETSSNHKHTKHTTTTKLLNIQTITLITSNKLQMEEN